MPYLPDDDKAINRNLSTIRNFMTFRNAFFKLLLLLVCVCVCVCVYVHFSVCIYVCMNWMDVCLYFYILYVGNAYPK